jgi:heme a synthase
MPSLHTVTTRILSRLTVGTTLVLVAFGGFTRGSGSGFGCKDRWPLCEDGLLGGLLPRLDFHMIIEWTHRWLAGLVGILAIATAVVAWRRARRWVAWVAIAGVATIGVQAWVGRLVVVENLDADLVSLHLAISMTVTALFVIVAVATTPQLAEPRHGGWVARSATGAVVAATVLMLGSFVHNVYIPGWPLAFGEWVPDLSGTTVLLHWLHRLIGGVGLVYLGWLSVEMYRQDRPVAEQILIWTAGIAYSVNIGLGAAHVFTEVMWSGLVAAHLGAASIVWAAMIAMITTTLGLASSRPE